MSGIGIGAMAPQMKQANLSSAKTQMALMAHCFGAMKTGTVKRNQIIVEASSGACTIMEAIEAYGMIISILMAQLHLSLLNGAKMVW